MKNRHAIIVNAGNDKSMDLGSVLFDLGVSAVTVTHDFSEAWRLLKKDELQVPAIFLDPSNKAESLAFLRRLMADSNLSESPVILITSSPATELMWAFEAGAVGRIAAPVDKVEAQRVIDRFLKIRSRAS